MARGGRGDITSNVPGQASNRPRCWTCHMYVRNRSSSEPQPRVGTRSHYEDASEVDSGWDHGCGMGYGPIPADGWWGWGLSSPGRLGACRHIGPRGSRGSAPKAARCGDSLGDATLSIRSVQGGAVVSHLACRMHRILTAEQCDECPSSQEGSGGEEDRAQDEALRQRRAASLCELVFFL